MRRTTCSSRSTTSSRAPTTPRGQVVVDWPDGQDWPNKRGRRPDRGRRRRRGHLRDQRRPGRQLVLATSACASIVPCGDLWISCSTRVPRRPGAPRSRSSSHTTARRSLPTACSTRRRSATSGASGSASWSPPTTHCRTGCWLRSGLGGTEPEKFRSSMRERLLEEFEASGCEQVLLSDETLFGALVPTVTEVRRLADAIAGSVRVLGVPPAPGRPPGEHVPAGGPGRRRTTPR